MLCLRCGQEYEGQSCPRCDGPVVIVNNSDYLARKKAYEEKQAKLSKPASSASKKSRDSVRRKRVPTRTSVRNNSRKKWYIISVASICIVVALVMSVVGIYRLATRKERILYMSYNDKIYNVSGLESSFVCEEKDAIFTADNESFYQPEWPESIDRDKVIQTLASTNGKYYAAVVYNENTVTTTSTGITAYANGTASSTENSDTYELYIWSTSDDMLQEKSTSRYELIYITDDGALTYASDTIINIEGSIEKRQLQLARIVTDKDKNKSITTTTIEDNLQKACIYTECNKIITLSTDNELYVYDYSKNIRLMIDDDTDGFLVYNKQHYYSSGTINVCSDSGVDTFYYVSDNKYYQCSLTDNTCVYIATSNGSNVAFYTDSKNKHIYMDSSGKLYDIVTDKEGNVSEPTQIVDIGSQHNLCFLQADGILLLVDSTSQLVKIHNGEIQVMENGIADGSLSLATNTTDYICYIKNSRLYYKPGINADAVQIMSNQSFTTTGGITLYKKHLYYYNSNSILYCCTLKGKDETSIGNVDRFWIGLD